MGSPSRGLRSTSPLSGSTAWTTKRSSERGAGPWMYSPILAELGAVTGADELVFLVVPVVQAAQVGADFVKRHHALIGVREPQLNLGQIFWRRA